MEDDEDRFKLDAAEFTSQQRFADAARLVKPGDEILRVSRGGPSSVQSSPCSEHRLGICIDPASTIRGLSSSLDSSDAVDTARMNSEMYVADDICGRVFDHYGICFATSEDAFDCSVSRVCLRILAQARRVDVLSWVSGYGYYSGFRRMCVLSMTTSGAIQLPTLFSCQSDRVAYFRRHSTSLTWSCR